MQGEGASRTRPGAGAGRASRVEGSEGIPISLCGPRGALLSRLARCHPTPPDRIESNGEGGAPPVLPGAASCEPARPIGPPACRPVALRATLGMCCGGGRGVGRGFDSLPALF